MARRPVRQIPLLESTRPEIPYLKSRVKDPTFSLEDLSRIWRDDRPFPRVRLSVARALFCKFRGSNLYQKSEIREAREQYLCGVRELLQAAVVPPIDFRRRYIKLNTIECLDLAALCNNIAITYSREGNTESALLWLEELVYVYQLGLPGQRPEPQERKERILFEDFYSIAVKGLARRAVLLNNLHNTALASWMLFDAQTLLPPVTEESPSIPSMDNLRMSYWPLYNRLLGMKHPDLSIADVMHKVTDPKLQIRGSWTKLRLEGKKIIGRMGPYVFVWSSRLYVFGGRNDNDSEMFLYDFYYLDLKKDPLGGWVKLSYAPRLPGWPLNDRPTYFDFKSVVVDDTFWIIVGIKQLLKFTLTTSKWSIVETTFNSPNPWPYDDDCEAPAVAAHKGIIYVFGGQEPTHIGGTNVLMSLDTQTLRWTHISGTPDEGVDRSLPGRRSQAEAWVDPQVERLFILFGRTEVDNLEGPGTDTFPYSDMWSFHIPTSTWRQERLHGNPPCGRTEFGCCYNTVLKKTFLFGGYSSALLSAEGESMTHGYSYFGDTFMWSPESNIWAQVMTHGFPAHRAQTPLVSDPDTGRMYLFGGYTSPNYVGAGKDLIVHCYSDIWQLRIDLPGGELESVDLQDEARLARLGVAKTCFNCGAIGRGFKRCGGTCKGAAAYCSKECSLEAWPKHRRKHGCRKQ